MRFWRSVQKRGDDECWPWQGAINRTGYGFIGSGNRNILAHRLSYELQVGPIPDGLVIDHVAARGCTLRNCVNPAHLEPVTADENTRRGNGIGMQNAAKTHCPRGHEYDKLYKHGEIMERVCSTCAREALRRFRARARARKATS